MPLCGSEWLQGIEEGVSEARSRLVSVSEPRGASFKAALAEFLFNHNSHLQRSPHVG